MRLPSYFVWFCALPALFCCSISHAQEAPSNAGQPIEITASKSVDWMRNDKQYVARENVVVTQGSVTIKSDLLTADYREGATSSMEIWQLSAQGNVTIADDKNTAYGDMGVYDVDTGVATLTGSNLKLVSPDQTVTAVEKMEYFANEKKARAVGHAKVIRANDTLTASTITAFFKEDGSAAKPSATQGGGTSPLGGSGALDRLEADGNVIIKTPTETLYGQKAIYKAATNTAELIGKVRVERDKNVLEGARAEVNLTTNVSKMFGSDKQGERVRGVFYPSDKKTAKPQSAPAATPAAPKTAPMTQTAPVPSAPAAEPQSPENPPVAPPKAQTSPDSPFAGASAPARVSPRVAY